MLTQGYPNLWAYIHTVWKKDIFGFESKIKSQYSQQDLSEHWNKVRCSSQSWLYYLKKFFLKKPHEKPTHTKQRQDSVFSIKRYGIKAQIFVLFSVFMRDQLHLNAKRFYLLCQILFHGSGRPALLTRGEGSISGEWCFLYKTNNMTLGKKKKKVLFFLLV